VVDGRILKRGGKLTTRDVAMVVREAAESPLEPRQRARWS
jgi:hypothetical protein